MFKPLPDPVTIPPPASANTTEFKLLFDIRLPRARRLVVYPESCAATDLVFAKYFLYRPGDLLLLVKLNPNQLNEFTTLNVCFQKSTRRLTSLWLPTSGQ